MITGVAFRESTFARAIRCFETALPRYCLEASAVALSSGRRDERSRAEIANKALRTMSDENAIIGISKSHMRSRGVEVMGDNFEHVVCLEIKSLAKLSVSGTKEKK